MQWREITQAGRQSRVQEMPKNNCTKLYTWEGYTGEPEDISHITTNVLILSFYTIIALFFNIEIYFLNMKVNN